MHVDGTDHKNQQGGTPLTRIMKKTALVASVVRTSVLIVAALSPVVIVDDSLVALSDHVRDNLHIKVVEDTDV